MIFRFTRALSALLLLATSPLIMAQNSVVVIPLAGEVVKTDSTFLVPSGWACTAPESCQDVFEVSISEPTTASFIVDNITGISVVRVAMYAPGVALGGENLIAGQPFELQCFGQDGTNVYANLQLDTAGIYKLVVTRDYGSSQGAAGTYELSLTAGTTISYVQQSVDDVASVEGDSSTCPGD